MLGSRGKKRHWLQPCESFREMRRRSNQVANLRRGSNQVANLSKVDQPPRSPMLMFDHFEDFCIVTVDFCIIGSFVMQSSSRGLLFCSLNNPAKLWRTVDAGSDG
jgi:hypothetical protein